MRPLSLRIKLTLFYSITVSVLLAGFSLVYYRVLSLGLDRDLTQEVIDRTSGLRGYLRFEEGLPAFAYDPNDPDELSFINTATRYYQVYEIRNGTVLAESDELRALGVEYSAEDLSRYIQAPPSLTDLQT